ncbi:hypothetical protein KY328_02235 [Candidatus Woesearchaeota archaeon]|nr:hypothetical protein [Candidatus Woesearchaeota archaeon]
MARHVDLFIDQNVGVDHKSLLEFAIEHNLKESDLERIAAKVYVLLQLMDEDGDSDPEGLNCKDLLKIGLAEESCGYMRLTREGLDFFNRYVRTYNPNIIN